MTFAIFIESGTIPLFKDLLIIMVMGSTIACLSFFTKIEFILSSPVDFLEGILEIMPSISVVSVGERKKELLTGVWPR